MLLSSIFLFIAAALIAAFYLGTVWASRGLKIVLFCLLVSDSAFGVDFTYTPPEGGTQTPYTPYGYFGSYYSADTEGSFSAWNYTELFHSYNAYLGSMDLSTQKNAFWSQNTNDLLYGVFGPEGSGTQFFSDFKEYARDFKISYVETAEGVTKVSVELLGFKDKFSEMLGKTSTIAENTTTIAGHLDSIKTSFIATNERLDTLRVTVNSVDGKMIETNNLLGEIKNNGINANMQGVEGRLDGIGGQLGVINSTLNQILSNGINADMSGLEQKLDTTNQTLGTVGQNTAGMAMDLVEIKNAVWALGNQEGPSMTGVETRLDGIRQRMDSPFQVSGSFTADMSGVEDKLDTINRGLGVISSANNIFHSSMVDAVWGIRNELGGVGQVMDDLVYIGDGIWARVGDQVEEQKETNRLLDGVLNVTGSVSVPNLEKKADEISQKLSNLGQIETQLGNKLSNLGDMLYGISQNQLQTNDLLDQILNQESSVDMSETNGLLGDILGVLTDFYEKFCSLFEDTGDSLGNGDDIVGKATELKNSIDELQDFTDSVDSSPLQSLKNQLPDNVGVTPHSWVFSCMVFQQRIEIQMPDIPYAATFRNFLSGLFIAMTAVYAVMIIIKNVREFA